MPPWKRRLAGLVLIVRPGNVALTAFSVLIGGVCAESPWGWALGVACISAALIAGGGYVANDVFDLAIDRVNRPHRPLPRGDLSLHAAGAWAGVLMATGVGMSWLLGWQAGFLATGIALALLAYAAYLKRTFLVGHLVVATMSGCAFLYGGLTGVRTEASLAPAVLAGAFHLGREMLKAAADRVGDSEGGANTMAVRWGAERTCRLAAMPLACVVVLSPLPTAWGWFGIPYLVMVVLGVDTVLLYAILRAWTSPGIETARDLANLLKWDMLAGLVAVGGDRWMGLLSGTGF